ncbi:hypothetical protein LP417_26980 [Polaromonas sp. P1-6]|nr:hypothetical protein LP417_26980 [Polaromonas sp. P1-6]
MNTPTSMLTTPQTTAITANWRTILSLYCVACDAAQPDWVAWIVGAGSTGSTALIRKSSVT